MPKYVNTESAKQNTWLSLMDDYLDREFIEKITEISATYTALTTDHSIWVDTDTNAVTVTLPDPALTEVGRTFLIKDKTGNANTKNITISPNVDGSSKTISTDYGSLRVQCNGTVYGEV